MNTITYAIYGIGRKNARTYIGTVDTEQHAKALAKRWLDDYPSVVISEDALVEAGCWISVETKLEKPNV